MVLPMEVNFQVLQNLKRGNLNLKMKNYTTKSRDQELQDNKGIKNNVKKKIKQ